MMYIIHIYFIKVREYFFNFLFLPHDNSSCSQKNTVTGANINIYKYLTKCVNNFCKKYCIELFNIFYEYNTKTPHEKKYKTEIKLYIQKLFIKYMYL